MQPIDTDASRLSPHHTTGNGNLQAARGDHLHNGENGLPLEFVGRTVTGSLSGGTALQNLISILGLVDGTSP